MIKELGKICYFENKFKKTEIIIKNVISSNFGKIFLKISTFDAKIKIDFSKFTRGCPLKYLQCTKIFIFFCEHLCM